MITFRVLKKNSVSVKVLHHIIQATKYYVYKKNGNELAMKKVFLNIVDSVEFKDTVDLSTIDGCKAIAWSTFHEVECVKAISYARSAIEQNSKCPLWYYILTKNLRRQRRLNFPSPLLAEEKKSISKCCELSTNNFYKLLYAQILHDDGQYGASVKVYLEIHQSNPISVNIQLQLALAFLRNQSYRKAKLCLDYVQNHQPDNKVFVHYKGIYIKRVEKNYEVNYFDCLKNGIKQHHRFKFNFNCTVDYKYFQNNFQEALRYFKKTFETQLNYPASIAYAQCLMKLNKVSQCIQHLHEMLQIYKDDIKTKQ